MKLWGALLVVACGASLGFSAGGAVHRAVSLTAAAEVIIRRLQTLVCSRRLPLPLAVSCLHEEYPLLFPEESALKKELQTRSFGSVWADRLHKMSLPSTLERILEPLGRELSFGEDPEQCFERTLAALRAYHEQGVSKTQETLRLYPALGISAGLLLAIVLI